MRVQGGAYGCGCNIQRSGLSYFYSYRDPRIQETYHIYGKLWQDVMEFTASEREMTKYILGTINRLEQPKTNMEKLNEAINLSYKEITAEALKQERLEILQTSAEDIRSCAELLKLISGLENACTIGSEQKIKDETDSEFFQTVRALL